MKEHFDNSVANGVATKKKYVSPEIEVVNLEEQPKLLSSSTGSYSSSGAGFDDAAREEW